MAGLNVSLLSDRDAGRVEDEFNSRWPWPRPSGFIAALVGERPHFVARDEEGLYLGHCHIRSSPHEPFARRRIPEIADLNVMPDSRRRGAATALLDVAEEFISRSSDLAGIGVGLYDDYGPAQRLYTGRGYVLDGTGAWSGKNQLRGGDVVTADDDLVLYLTKRVR